MCEFPLSFFINSFYTAWASFGRFMTTIGAVIVDLHLNLLRDLHWKLLYQKTKNPSPELRFAQKLWGKLKCKNLSEMDQSWTQINNPATAHRCQRVTYGPRIEAISFEVAFFFLSVSKAAFWGVRLCKLNACFQEAVIQTLMVNAYSVPFMPSTLRISGRDERRLTKVRLHAIDMRKLVTLIHLCTFYLW